MRIRRHVIRLEPLPCVVLLLIVALITAIVFFAPAENANAALSGASVLGLIVQASVRSALRVTREEQEDVGES